MSFAMKVISALGSCRVTNPLRQAVSKYPVIFNSSRIYGYTHSAAETVQLINFIKGRFQIADELRPFLVPSIAKGLHENAVHRPSDLYVVEISSAKNLRIGTTLVQWNHFCRYFAAFLAEQDRAKIFWSLAKPGDESELIQFLKSEKSFQNMSMQDQRHLCAVNLQMADAASLREEINTILQELGQVVFVTHFNPHLPDGTKIASRNRFIDLLKSVLQTCGATFYDPTELVTCFGQDRAIQSENGSYTHYTPQFESALFADWYGRYFQPSRTTTLAMAV
jgi:Vi polysaccharide biosynthesis protein TviD